LSQQRVVGSVPNGGRWNVLVEKDRVACIPRHGIVRKMFDTARQVGYMVKGEESLLDPTKKTACTKRNALASLGLQGEFLGAIVTALDMRSHHAAVAMATRAIGATESNLETFQFGHKPFLQSADSDQKTVD
jgi:hypothetical protein